MSAVRQSKKKCRTMKAFLSHSSKDKGFVESVAGLLRPGTFELNSATFDAGLVNSQAIIAALQRSDLFCLFLSSNSITSAYVEFETLLGIEFFASGKIGQFLAICRDEQAFDQASANVKFFNVVRKVLEIEATAHLIRGHLISAAELSSLQAHPFIGREEELLSLERQVTDYRRPPSRALFISGNFGAARRTIAEKFYGNQFPKVGRSFPTINIDPFSGIEELHRKVLTTLRPALSTNELKTRVQAFTIAASDEKRRLVAQLLNSLLFAHEAALLVDKGGLLTDDGRLTGDVNEIVARLESKPHPPVVFIAPRMIPLRLRRPEDDMSYLAVKSLDNDSSTRLISKLLRDNAITPNDHDIVELIADSGDCGQGFRLIADSDSDPSRTAFR